MKALESERLYLRKLVEDDFDIFYHLESDPAVMRYIGGPKSKKEARDRMQRSFNQYEDGTGFAKWMAVEKATNEPIGWFVLTPLDGTKQIEIGYRLLESSWNKGYATEMAKVVLDYGFNTLDLDRIVGITHLENEASAKVLKKIGLDYIGIDYFYNRDVHFYAKDKPK